MAWFAADSGKRLWYEDQGAGTPIVFIHGWCMSSAVWRLQQEGLAGSFRIIAVDLQGHGKSPPDSAGFNLKDCARDIAGLFDHLQLDSALLAGWSLGSLVALESVTYLRAQLCGLVLISGTPRFTQGDGFPYGMSRIDVDGMSRKVQRNIRRARDGFTERMFAPGERDDPVLAVTISEILSAVPLPSVDVALQALDVLVESDLRDGLASIGLPTLIVNGDCDLICPPQVSDYLTRRIATARHTVFDGCGHAPFLTQAARFNACLEEFREVVCGRAN